MMVSNCPPWSKVAPRVQIGTPAALIVDFVGAVARPDSAQEPESFVRLWLGVWNHSATTTESPFPSALGVLRGGSVSCFRSGCGVLTHLSLLGASCPSCAQPNQPLSCLRSMPPAAPAP